jgi:hypothetical protein
MPGRGWAVLGLGTKGGEEQRTGPGDGRPAASGHLLPASPPQLAIAATLALAAAIVLRLRPLLPLPLVAASLVALAERGPAGDRPRRRRARRTGRSRRRARPARRQLSRALGVGCWPALPRGARLWRLAEGASCCTRRRGSLARRPLPLAPAALPLLLPAVVIGPGCCSGLTGDDALGVGLVALPFLAPSAAVAAAVASLRCRPRLTRRERGCAPPAALAAADPACLLGRGEPAPGATLAHVAAVALRSHRAVPVARLAFLLPAAGLLWTLPVEGIDRQLQPRESLDLGQERAWVLMVGSRPGEEGGRLEGGDGRLPAEGNVWSSWRSGSGPALDALARVSVCRGVE